MTSKERIMCAISNKVPDRLPVTIHQWQPYHLKKYMGGMSDIQANRHCGLDASICVCTIDYPSDVGWKVSYTQYKHGAEIYRDYTIETPKGKLTTTEGTNEMTTWVTKGLIKEDDDIFLLKYRTVPILDKKEVRRKYSELGDDGIIRTFLCGKQGGCWQDACELYGVERLILACFDKPEWVHQFLEILLDWKLKFVEANFGEVPIDLVETGGGASSNTVISPAIHEEFCLPYDKRLHKALRQLDLFSVYHTCGGMSKITQHIISNGCDVSETLSPGGVGGDIVSDLVASEVYSALHPHVALIGGMDQLNILEKGSMAEIIKEVERLFQIFGQGGGYIMSASDHFFEVPVENLSRFAYTAKQYRY